MKAKEYTIKIIPDESEDVHTFRLSAALLKYGVFAFGAFFALCVGAFGYAAYSNFAAKSDAKEIGQLRQVNGIQQEQLLQLSKKAAALQGTAEELKERENELRRLAGANPLTEEKADDDGAEKHEGEGGPVTSPTAVRIGEVLTNLEQIFEMRRQGLTEVAAVIDSRQEKMLAAGNVPASFVGAIFPGGIYPGNSTTPVGWPTHGDVSSPYGLRWNGSDFHPGIDIANDMGTPIVATADGTVVYAGWNAGGYGNMVDIDHGNGIMTRYAHAMQVTVMSGQYVKRGQLIAYMGSTGFSTGPHVHYEVRIGGQAINPITYM